MSKLNQTPFHLVILTHLNIIYTTSNIGSTCQDPHSDWQFRFLNNMHQLPLALFWSHHWKATHQCPLMRNRWRENISDVEESLKRNYNGFGCFSSHINSWFLYHTLGTYSRILILLSLRKIKGSDVEKDRNYREKGWGEKSENVNLYPLKSLPICFFWSSVSNEMLNCIMRSASRWCCL